MQRDGEVTGLLADGPRRLESASRRAEEAELSELRASLAATRDPVRRRELEAEILEAQARYREERRDLDYRLFLGD